MTTLSMMNTNNSSKLASCLHNLPNLPGVYQMLGENGEILYVGKAKSLKKRVSSYFNKVHDHPKTQALVMRIVDIELIVVRGETEALLLEQNLIKLHRPPYNVMLRDDKSYLYLFVSADKFPRLGIGRGRGNHKEGQVFGPYPSGQNAKEAVLMLQKMFAIRTCSNVEFNGRKRPCLEYQIKRCKAPCVGLIGQDEYAQDVASVVNFLRGETASVKEVLTIKMMEAAEAMQFEEAAILRDKLAQLSEIAAHQAVYKDRGEADVMSIGERLGVICVNVLTVRAGQVLGAKNYFLDELVACDELADDKLGVVLSEFLLAFYREVSEDVPSEIIVNTPIANREIIAELLKTPIKHQVKEHRQAWLNIASLNVENALKTKLADYDELNQRFFALQTVLKRVSDRAIDRIECFDISHTMGESAVGSCVVFDRGGSRRRDYRQYAIHDVVAGDDYAAMRQVLIRRYKKHPVPDLLLIDGGKGQLSVAKEVLAELDVLDDTLLMSVAKGEGRKAGLEVLHFLNHDPIDLPSDNKALHLVMQIRDEAHRFAITSHRKKRDKKRGASVLEVIPGIGKTKRQALLMHFGGIQQLLSASQDEIAEVSGIGKVLAATVYKALHG